LVARGEAVPSPLPLHHHLWEREKSV
jgi:hypothetical protein